MSTNNENVRPTERYMGQAIDEYYLRERAPREPEGQTSMPQQAGYPPEVAAAVAAGLARYREEHKMQILEYRTMIALEEARRTAGQRVRDYRDWALADEVRQDKEREDRWNAREKELRSKWQARSSRPGLDLTRPGMDLEKHIRIQKEFFEDTRKIELMERRQHWSRTVRMIRQEEIQKMRDLKRQIREEMLGP